MTDITFYRMEEVRQNNGKNGKRTWLVIKDSVYDVTDYQNEHPGGADLILDEAGKDATKPFNDFGHSSDAKAKMKKFKIGELAEEDRKQNNEKSKGPTIKSSNDVQSTRSCLSIITCGCLV